MSSALAHPLAAPFPQSSTAEFGSLKGPQRYTEQIKSWQSLVTEGRLRSCFASVLPTPSEAKAMTGISLDQHNSNRITSQNHHPPRSSYASHLPSAGAEVRPTQHNLKGYHHTGSSRRDQPQIWTDSREQENRHVPRDSLASDLAIASYLQIPSSINDSRGSLAEFAAEVGQNLVMGQTLLTF